MNSEDALRQSASCTCSMLASFCDLEGIASVPYQCNASVPYQCKTDTVPHLVSKQRLALHHTQVTRLAATNTYVFLLADPFSQSAHRFDA